MGESAVVDSAHAEFTLVHVVLLRAPLSIKINRFPRQ